MAKAPRMTLAQAKNLLGVAKKKVRHRLSKPSAVDLLSLSPGAWSTYAERGSLEAMMDETARASLMANYVGYNPQTGAWSFQRAWDRQWKPFTFIQIGQHFLGHTKIGRRLKNWKVPFLNVKLIN